MKKDPKLFIPVADGKQFFHHSRELIESDIKYLMDEVSRSAKQHSLPYFFQMETDFDKSGTGFLHYGFYPSERFQSIGFTARALLGHFLCTADSMAVEKACQLLIKKKIIK